MRSDERRSESANILMSTLVERSVEARPSVSTRSITWSGAIWMGLFHSQMPFVHACVVDPISNPFDWFSSRFAKNDLPVRYGPAIAAIDSFRERGRDYSRDIAEECTSNKPDFASMVINGIAFPSLC